MTSDAPSALYSTAPPAAVMLLHWALTLDSFTGGSLALCTVALFRVRYKVLRNLQRVCCWEAGVLLEHLLVSIIQDFFSLNAFGSAAAYYCYLLFMCSLCTLTLTLLL